MARGGWVKPRPCCAAPSLRLLRLNSLCYSSTCSPPWPRSCGLCVGARVALNPPLHLGVAALST
jgi:hypothetical protein